MEKSALLKVVIIVIVTLITHIALDGVAAHFQ
jgi:hypothetical protein